MNTPSIVPWRGSGQRDAVRGAFVRREMPFGLPLTKGPWGRITAIDMHTGDHAWVVPNVTRREQSPRIQSSLEWISAVSGTRESSAACHQDAVVLRRGEREFSSGPGGGGPLFRALDKTTGKTLHEMTLPANETGIPMTFLARGKQCIVVAIGNRDFPPKIVALTLP